MACFQSWVCSGSHTIPLMPPMNRIFNSPEGQPTQTRNTELPAAIYYRHCCIPINQPSSSQHMSLPYDCINIMKACFLISLILQKPCSQCGTVTSPTKQRFTAHRGPVGNTTASYSGSHGFKPRSRNRIHTSRFSLFGISRYTKTGRQYCDLGHSQFISS
jgi:hypothetical protein